jgi:hypothetical protein
MRRTHSAVDHRSLSRFTTNPSRAHPAGVGDVCFLRNRSRCNDAGCGLGRTATQVCLPNKNNTHTDISNMLACLLLLLSWGASSCIQWWLQSCVVSGENQKPRFTLSEKTKSRDLHWAREWERNRNIYYTNTATESARQRVCIKRYIEKDSVS